MNKEVLDEVKRLYVNDHLTMVEISKRFLVDPTTIRYNLIEAGVEIRRRWAKDTRVCRGVCGKELPVSSFYGKHYVCKKCLPTYQREKGYAIKKNFGITREEYISILEKQEYKCAVCGKSQDENGVELAVDHDHNTGNVRGLLCRKCNLGLGYFQDSQQYLQSAIKYLSNR